MVESNITPVSPISVQPPAGPREVVETFLRLTVDTPDLQKARLHLSKRSLETGDFHAAPAGSSYTLGAEESDELGLHIPVSMKSPLPGGTDMQEMTVPVVVVQEDGQWKIDLPATMDRLMGGVTAAVGQAMSAVGAALDTAMSGVGAALAEGLGGIPAPAKKALAAKPGPRKPAKTAKKPVKKPVPKAEKKAAAKKPAKRTAKVGKKAAQKPAKKPAKKPVKQRRK